MNEIRVWFINRKLRHLAHKRARLMKQFTAIEKQTNKLLKPILQGVAIHDPLVQPVLAAIHNPEFNPTSEELGEIQKRMTRDSSRFYGKYGDPSQQLTSEEYNPVAYLKQIRKEKGEKA